MVLANPTTKQLKQMEAKNKLCMVDCVTQFRKIEAKNKLCMVDCGGKASVFHRVLWHCTYSYIYLIEMDRMFRSGSLIF
jgi:hypothetical protein